MLFLNYLDKIPGKIFPKLKPKMIDGFMHFPCKLCREIFHIIGSLLLIIISYIFYLYIHVKIPIIIFTLLIIWMTYQEFYLHRKKYKQKLVHGLLDWFSWVIPFVIYLFILYYL